MGILAATATLCLTLALGVAPEASASVLPLSGLDATHVARAQTREPAIDWGSDRAMPDRLMGAWENGTFDENFPAGGSNNVVVPTSPSFELSLRAQLAGPWGLEVAARRWTGFSIIDNGNANSQHFRTQTMASVAVDRDFFPLGVRLTPSAGWFYRTATNANSVPPLLPLYVNSSSVAYTGPRLGLSADVPLWGPFSLTGAVGLDPFVLAAVDSNVPPFYPSLGGQAEAGLQLGLQHLVFEAGYGWSTLQRYTPGSGHALADFQDEKGPVVSCGWRY